MNTQKFSETIKDLYLVGIIISCENGEINYHGEKLEWVHIPNYIIIHHHSKLKCTYVVEKTYFDKSAYADFIENLS